MFLPIWINIRFDDVIMLLSGNQYFDQVLDGGLYIINILYILVNLGKVLYGIKI